MSVRKKTLIAIGLTSLSLLILLFALAQVILLRGFNQLQEQAVQQNIQRVRNVITNEIENLNTFSGDWAYWDDTYQYAQDKNQVYSDSNLNKESISNLKLNLFLVTDITDHVLFGSGFDLKESKLLPLWTDIDPQSDLLQPILDLPELTSNNTGIILSAEGSLMLASRPILTSQKEGPATGKLVFGRLLDDAKINEFAEQAQIAINILSLNSADLPADFASARSSLLAADTADMIYSLQDHTANGYTLLNDITGKPILLVKIGMSDSIYQQGQQSVLYFVIALLVVGLTFSAVVMWFLERIVLSRLGYLSKRVDQIASGNTLSERIKMDGSDELASLTASINNSLDVMEHSQVELQRLNDKLGEKVNDLNNLQVYRDHFFNNASQEFRTPMAVLRTQLFLAQKQPELWQKHLDILVSNTNRLSDILNDVFDMAQFKRQNGTIYRQEVEFKNLVNYVISVERQNTYHKGLQLCAELPDYDLYIKGEQSALENAVEKLLVFITHYCEQGSEIHISLVAKFVGNASYAQFEIKTNGLHIPQSDLPQIFLPFYKSSDGHILNTRLQLSIAKEITELHKGELSAQIYGEKGICFRIKLPVTRMSPEPVK